MTKDWQSSSWEVGGPYPGTSVIYMTDAGCGWPEPEPPAYEPICVLDQRIEGEPNKEARAIAARIVAEHNACVGVPSDRLSPGLLKTMIGAMNAGMDEARRRDAFMEEMAATIRAVVEEDGFVGSCLMRKRVDAMRAVLAKLESPS